MMVNYKFSGQHITDKAIAKLIHRARINFRLPGLGVSVMSADNIYISEVGGTKVSGSNHLITEDDYFHIGSCSKSVLGLIAARFVEVNRIQWTTTFFELFPELKASANSAYIGVTLEDLLLCEGGILAYTTKEEWSELITRANSYYDFAQFLIAQSPVSTLKSNGKYEHLYSNASYTMACLMLEKVSGKKYEDLINQYVVKEMGLNVYIGFPNSLNDKQPWGHIITAKSLEQFPPTHNYRVPNLIQPAGNLSMSLFDFAKYIQLHLKGLQGEDNFISAKAYQYLHFARQGFSIGIGNGKMGGHPFSGMDGSAGTFYCRAILMPDANFAFTIMTNAGSGSGKMKAVDWLTMKIVKKYYKWWWKCWM